MEDIRQRIQEAATERLLFLPHAVTQMSRPDRMISTDGIEDVVWNGEVIEDYPEDRRGHSCLMLGFDERGRALHVVCAPKAEYLAVITAYRPAADLWSDDFKRRKT